MPSQGVVDEIEMSDVAADIAADVVAFLAVDTDVLAADTRDVLAADTTDVLSAAKAASDGRIGPIGIGPVGIGPIGTGPIGIGPTGDAYNSWGPGPSSFDEKTLRKIASRKNGPKIQGPKPS